MIGGSEAPSLRVAVNPCTLDPTGTVHAPPLCPMAATFIVGGGDAVEAQPSFSEKIVVSQLKLWTIRLRLSPADSEIVLQSVKYGLADVLMEAVNAPWT